MILQRSVHVYCRARYTKGMDLFEDQFVWKVPPAKARVFRSASVNDLRRAFCTLRVKMTLQATNARLAIWFCWRAFLRTTVRKQRESGESEGIEGAVLHQRFLFSHGSNYSYFLVCDVFRVGSSPKTEKHHGGHQSTIALAAGGEHPKQPPHSMQVLPMMLHLPIANGLSN